MSEPTGKARQRERKRESARERISFAAMLPILASGVAGSILLGLSSVSLPPAVHPMCIEGGEYFGFPVAFYIRCYGPVIPGDGQTRDEPILDPIAIVLDAGFWFATAGIVLFLIRRMASVISTARS